MCVTSCARHDLLRATLESFYENCKDEPPQEILIYEDSETPKPDWLNDFVWKQRGLKWMSDGIRKGQAYACARLIREAQYEWIFWCEDDWLFQRNSGEFMRESKKILNAHPEVIKVSLRGDTGWHPLKRAGDIFVAEPYWRGVWGGWAWNPGLSRAQDVKALLPFLAPTIGESGLQHEEKLSKRLLDDGRRIADLNRCVVSHIGGSRSRAREKLPPLPRILVAIPTCFELDYESHALQNKEKFHTNGPNEQTQCVRETWAKDFEPYPTVDVKFFYGKPKSGYPREPLADEVFLDCGDGYDSLIDKTVGICKYANSNGYKWLYKCDTDTFVYADRLLVEMVENSAPYAGYRHANVASGGPGYILSEQAIRILATQSPKRHPYAEDCTVAWTLAKNGITPTMLPDHHSGMSAHFFFGAVDDFVPEKIPEGIVSAHAVFPDVMRRWHEWRKTH